MQVGETKEFTFFRRAPENLTAISKQVLYNGLLRPDLIKVLRCQVLKITHQRLGELRQIHVKRCHNVFVLGAGDEVWVDSELEPGLAVHERYRDISDWSLLIRMMRT
jgi:hypothetical protein